MRNVFSVFFALVIILGSGCVLDTGDVKYTVSGYITKQDGTPLAGVYVVLGGTSEMTNSKGFYKFSNIEYNSYYLEADPYDILSSKYRFEPIRQLVSIKGNTRIDFTAFSK